MKTRAPFLALAAAIAITLMGLAAACGGQSAADATPIALERATPTATPAPTTVPSTATSAPTAAPTSTPAPAAEPSASQGERVLFVSKRDGNWEIYSMNADGSSIIRLTNHDADDSHPDSSPDGQRIAFISNRDGDFEIYAMNADGSDVTRLTNNAAADIQPAWSPDGRRIAFVSKRYDDRSDSLLATEIYVMNADGSDMIRIANADAWQSAPAWSPDGQRILSHRATKTAIRTYTR